MESKWAGSTVLVTPWHLFISAGFDEHYSASPKVLKLWARIWALQGLLTFKDSVYYESNITDSHGKYEAHVDRRDYADELAIDAEQNKLHAQITSKPSR